jgi:dTDP-4-amino-4,6-dideoxygalactose transaminase
MQDCYPELRAEDNDLPNTSHISYSTLSLPMFSELTNETVEGIIEAITRIYSHARELERAFKGKL